MGLKQSLRRSCVKIYPGNGSVDSVLREIADIAVSSPILDNYNPDEIYELLRDREAIGTTGIGSGIAIPHCTIEGLSDFVVGILVSPEGVDFRAADKKPAHLIFFIIGPRERRDEHIQILSSISKISKVPYLLAALKNENSPDNIYRILTEDEGEPVPVTTHRPKCMFQVFIQRDDIFDDILEILSAEEGVSIAVTETRNAGYYLHTMPLFSSFWSEDNRTFSRTISAVVNKSSVNDLVRRINMLSDSGTTAEEVMIAVHDLFYTSGGISF